MNLKPVVKLGSYKLDTVVYNDLGRIKNGFHVPYVVGAIVIGPKGGKYMLDNYLIELYLRLCGFEFIRAVDVLNDLINKGYVSKKKVCIKSGVTPEDTARKAGQMLNCKTMSRAEGVGVLQGWARG